jgi:hypothetical protein
VPTDAVPPLTMQGRPVAEAALMRDGTSLLGDPDAISHRMATEGYLYLPGYLGRERVEAARRVFVDALAGDGLLEPGTDPMDGVLRAGAVPRSPGGRLQTLFRDWRPVHDVLYGGPMIGFFEGLFGESVRHYDFTWTRQIGPGLATPAHSDVVYMGRGTHELFTAWTPMGDNGFDLGGLVVLEGSHNHAGLAKGYFRQDVDAFCENRPDSTGWGKAWGTGGHLRAGPEQLRRGLGAERWVTANYRMGDVVLFSVYTVHGGTDNRTTRRIRLSTDTRYQRASAPADERWIGPAPIGHGLAARRGVIC